MGKREKSRGPSQRIATIASSFLTAIVLAAALFGLASSSWPQDMEANEYQIKAAYLLNFPNFVDWPGAINNDLQSPVRLCLLGSDPLGSALSRMMADRLSRGRSLLLRRVFRTDPVSDCQILYIGPSESKYIPQILDSLHNVSALTVGETDKFAEQGGMIQLVMEEDRIRFKINPTAASQAGIRISSKLLALAQIVSPAKPMPGANSRHQVTLKDESFGGWTSTAPFCWRIEHTGLLNISLVA
ncbi:MAG TPA: YfiR family protein [Candidatus Acidoferrales bacterium]|jgi:hypothetical protein|nr:YfiR family protein [Candidatus Acidoferrales bacterium]